MSALLDHLRKRIAKAGPLSVAAYMEEALGHPEHGYYRKKDPLGARGDFITAPEVSQMFGEVIGLWCAVAWAQAGEPARAHLVELGPGRGTLMADMLRALKVAPPVLAALEVHMVETSPALMERQKQALADAPVPVHWHSHFAEVPEGPLIVVANEFFDALPIRQFVRMPADWPAGDWAERMVGLDDDDNLCWAVVPGGELEPGLVPSWLDNVTPGAVFESCPAAQVLAQAIGARLARFGGAALVIDYGHPQSAPGETLQALKAHSYHNPLEDPGEADLTAHVDFQALGEAARRAGAKAYGPITQGGLLQAVGIGARAEALKAAGDPDQAKEVDVALERLIGEDQMGTLFKALAVTGPRQPVPPGFE